MLARILLALSFPLFVGSTMAAEINLPQSKHGLHFTNAVQVWDEALPLGNGILGALVWGGGQPMKISLDRTDLWDLSPVPEFHASNYNYATMRRWHEQGKHADLVRVYEAPYNRPAPTKIPAGRIELTLPAGAMFLDTSLTLADAMAEMRFTNGLRARVFLHAEQPVGMIQFGSAPPRGITPKLIPPPFGGKIINAARGGIGAGDLAQLGYPAPVPTSGRNWQAFTQRGAQGFHFAAYLEWRERDGEWLAAWSVASSFEGPEPLQLARRRVEEALSKGFEAMVRSHIDWWQRYWSKSSVTLPNAVIERQWFLEQYKFGAASRRGAPPITLQGPWTADDGQLPPWKGDYHHDLNTQLSYWPCYSGNHLEEGLSYLDWLWATRSNCVAWTKRFFNLPGLNVPMTSDLNNSQIGGWRQYTHSATTAAWLAQHFYWHWKFSADRAFLRDRAWPYLRDAIVFIEAITANKNARGRRTLPLSSSPEIHDNRPQAWFKEVTNYDLALIRWLLGATAELAEEMKLAEEAKRWRRTLGELPEFALAEDGRLLVAPGEPLKESHRHFSHLMAIHPLGLVDVADSLDARRTVEASLRDLDRLGSDQWCGYSFAWLASLAARARDGAKAELALEVFSTAFTLRNSFHCNGDQSGKGYSKFRYRPFTLEGNFAAAAGVQEMLLQSHRGRIEVFPAVPGSWRDAAFTTLRAQGAFLVSAERRNGVTRRVEVESEKGGVCRLLSPWTGQELSFAMKPGEKRVLTDESRPQTTGAMTPEQARALASEILADSDLPLVLDKARALLKTGLTAGSGYGEVWIRDLNTFIEVSLEVNPAADIRAALLTFFKFQEANGDVPDGFIPKERGSVGYKYRRSALAPELLAHKNTVETDQESSLVLAVRKFVTTTGDRSLLTEDVGGKRVLDRLELALDYVLAERFDRELGLIWGATTADWGDVQPEHAWGVELDASSHRACDIYDNALFVSAVDDLLQLLGADSPRAARWRQVRDDLKRNIRKHLWDEARQKFVPHVYLAGSPFPKEFDEAAVYYHGGTAVAVEADLLTREEIVRVLASMRANVKAAGAASIGLTVYPPYPKGFFKNVSMGLYSYQNGGDWCWFGGRMIQRLIRNGFVREAYDELKPMVGRVKRHGDFYEWWSLDNQPRGSKQYRGSAGVLGKAIEQLLAWAKRNEEKPSEPKNDAHP